MINIFGVAIITKRDWNALTTEIDAMKEELREQNETLRISTLNVADTKKRLRMALSFILERMPMKRHRKEFRQIMPTNAECKMDCTVFRGM